MSDRRRSVLWSEAAVKDLEGIATYLAVDTPAAARAVLSLLHTKAAALELLPLRGRVVPELAQLGIRTWRELPARPYRIIYRITDTAVHVVAVFDARRDLEDVLLDRILRSA